MNMKKQPILLVSRKIAGPLQAIASAPRIAILLAIGQGEACVCHLETALGWRQAYISQHLMALRKADILQDRRELLRDIQADATSSSEILRLAALIDDVTLEIENIQGRLNFLKDQVAEATINVEVRERDVQREDPGPDTENPSIADSFELAQVK